MESILKYRIHFLRRIVSSFLIVIMLFMLPLNSYASAVASIASSSDASIFEESEYISGNIITPYAESFKHCPETLESILSSDSRFAVTSSAVLYVLTVILAACGIYISFEDDIIAIFTSFESWLRTNYGNNANVMKTWQDILGANAGSALYSMTNFIPIFKKYLNAELTGYGTDTIDFSFSKSPGIVITDVGKYVLPENDVLNVTMLNSSIYYYVFILKQNSTSGVYTIGHGLVSLDLFKVGTSSATTSYLGSLYAYNFSLRFIKPDLLSTYINNPYTVLIEGISIESDIKKYFNSSDFVIGESAVISVTVDKTWSDFQSKDDATNIEYGDTLTVPDTDEALQKILDALGIANTSKEVAEALAPSLTITDTGTGESGGESGDTSIINSILVAILALPLKIATEITTMMNDIPLFNGISLNLDSVASGIGDIASRIAQWDFSDWANALGTTFLLALSKFASDIGLDGIGDVLSRIAQWDFSDWDIALGALLLLSLKKFASDIGLDGIGDVLSRIAQWDFSDWANALGASFLLALLEFSSRIGLDGIAETLVNIRDGVLSIPDILNNLYEFVKTIPVAIATALVSLLSFEPSEEPNDKGFKNFLNIFMLLLFIVIMLIILFINCLRFIVLVFNIPSSTALFNEDVLSGIEFLKSIEIPLFGMSVYTLLLSVAYFVLFFSIIAMLRKKIDKFNL